MINENILGETRKWRVGSVEWSATVVNVLKHTALVNLRKVDGDEKNVWQVNWSAGELADHGFDIGTP